jgi:phosphate transport system substrate-binding protein
MNIVTMKNSNLIFALWLLLAATACEQKSPDGKVLDTPTTGHLKLLVDEGYQPVISSVLDVYDSIYSRASFEAKYVPEGEAVRALIDDSTEVIIIPRPLKDEETEYFKKQGIVPRVNVVAYDAVAFIINPSNKDSVLTVDQIKGILTGEIANWNQVNPKSGLGKINLVFDNANSSTVRYCRDSIITGKELTKAASAATKNEEVIAYVKKNKNAVGIIGANWISDSDDKGVQSFLKDIVMVDVAKAAGEEGFGPYQAYLATQKYPFRRGMYVINCQARAGLGLGLANFLISDPGQRIMLKEGLYPSNVPIRLIQVVRE